MAVAKRKRSLLPATARAAAATAAATTNKRARTASTQQRQSKTAISRVDSNEDGGESQAQMVDQLLLVACRSCFGGAQRMARIVATPEFDHRVQVRQRLTEAIRENLQQRQAKAKKPSVAAPASGVHSDQEDAANDDGNEDDDHGGIELLSDDACARHANQIERNLYERHFYSDPGRYAEKCRTLDYNLRRNAFYLLTRFGPDTVCVLPATKLAEQTSVGAWRDRQTKMALRNVRQPTSERKTKGQFRCPHPKCRSWNTTYYSMQTRSADEPMTNFVACLACNKRFKR